MQREYNKKQNENKANSIWYINKRYMFASFSKVRIALNRITFQSSLQGMLKEQKAKTVNRLGEIYNTNFSPFFLLLSKLLNGNM